MLTESILLALVGGTAGLLVSVWAIHVLVTLNPGNIPGIEDIRLNGSVLAFTLGISLVTGVLCGMAPAREATTVDLAAALKRGARSGRGLHLVRNRSRSLLVVSELALSLIVLVAAGLLIRSYMHLRAVPTGFTTDHVVSMFVLGTGPEFRQEEFRIAFCRELENRIAHLPGVRAEGVVSVLPLRTAGPVGWGAINVGDSASRVRQEQQADIRLASPEYFRTMEIPLLKGRFFTGHDTAKSQWVAIIDKSFARRVWPNQNVIGKHLWFNRNRPIVIVGVVGAVKQYGLETAARPSVYLPYYLHPDSGVYVVARTSPDPAPLAGPITRTIHAINRDVLVYDIRTMRGRLNESLARQRFATAMLVAFAVIALLLAATGVYGLMSSLVSQSTHDIGVRVALGAQWRHIAWPVIRRGGELVVIGIVVGLIGASAVTRVMTSLLFGVTARDTFTFSSVALLLMAVALAATLFPARRATRVDPVRTLRNE